MQDTELLSQLAEDIGNAQRLLDLIDQEYQALAERDLAGLETLLTQKQTTLALLGQHGARRSQALRQAGVTSDMDGMKAYAARSSCGAALLDNARQLEELLEACRQSNERNGKLIRANQTAVGGMLRILKGSAETPDLYDRRGSASKSTYHRPLSQA